jgi:hypothetical protein
MVEMYWETLFFFSSILRHLLDAILRERIGMIELNSMNIS